MSGKKFKIEFPHVFALMFILTIFMAFLTWVVPAGEFTRVKQGAITKVVAGSFHFVKAQPQGFWQIFEAVSKGWLQSAGIIFMVFLSAARLRFLNKLAHCGLVWAKL